MAAPLPRRFYQVLSAAMYQLIFWLICLLVAISVEAGEKDFRKHPEHSYSFFILTFPLYCLVLFGCYSLIAIGYHMIVLRKYHFILSFFGITIPIDILTSFFTYILDDCKDAQDELVVEIKQARAFLTSKGMKFE